MSWQFCRGELGERIALMGRTLWALRRRGRVKGSHCLLKEAETPAELAEGVATKLEKMTDDLEDKL